MAVAVRNTTRSLVGLHRTTVNRALAWKWIQNQLSTSAKLSQTSESSEKNTKIYEMRTYYVKPKTFAEFLQLTNDYIHLKSDANSKLNGYWTSDIGGVNEVTHIWEYDSYAQRAEARKALQQDQTWINSYIKKMLKMLVKQDNLVMTPVPWFDVKPPLTTGASGSTSNGNLLDFDIIGSTVCKIVGDDIITTGNEERFCVYELRMYDIVLGKTEQWVHRLVQGLPDRCKLSDPVGVWFTEFGPVNTAIMLWSYQSLDDRTRIRKEAQQLEEWVEAVRDCLPFERKAYSKVLVPTEFSPWK